RDNGVELLSLYGAWCPLARASRAVAAGAECPRSRRDALELTRCGMISTGLVARCSLSICRKMVYQNCRPNSCDDAPSNRPRALRPASAHGPDARREPR